MTLPEEQLTAAFATINDVRMLPDMPTSRGHPHGRPVPLPRKRKGRRKQAIYTAQRMFRAIFRRLSAASGNKIRIIADRPELRFRLSYPGFKDTSTISLGHSTASYKIAENAFAAGANHVTHLFNAMPPLHHRDPGIIGAAADCPHAMAEIICDGIH